jgi:hypothetical protein
VDIIDSKIFLIAMSDAAIGWTIIVGILFLFGSCSRSPEAAKSDPDLFKSTDKSEASIPALNRPLSDRPVTIGSQTWKNERELIIDVCKADPTIKGCR